MFFSILFNLQDAAFAAAKSLQSRPTMWDPIDGSPPGSPIPGILQARTLQWVCHFRLQCMKVKSESEVAQSCPTLCHPMDCSLPGGPWGFPDKSTGAGCHCLLQSMKWVFTKATVIIISWCTEGRSLWYNLNHTQSCASITSRSWSG